MIPSLLLVFRGYSTKECNLAPQGCQLKIENNVYHFGRAIYFIQFVVLGWLIFKGYNFHSLSARPQALFEPMHYFGKLFMPLFPSSFLFYGVILLGLITTVLKIINDDKIFTRIIQFVIVAWVNVFQWSFGFESAVSYTLIYVLLFSLFIPVKGYTTQDLPSINKMIEYFFVGIFITYTFSGIWKVVGVSYKLLLKPEDVHWLSPNGALYNAVVSYRNYDLPIEPILKYYQYPLFWQMSFLIVLFIQLFCWLAAYRLQLRMWAGLSLIIFHAVNALFFKTVFITAPIVLLTICFPYHLFIKNELTYDKKIFFSEDNELKYTKTYPNGDMDWYKGFTAYREIMYDKNRVFGSLLFVPGVFIFYKMGILQKLIKTPPATINY